jgi:hypothetical protein
MAECFKLTAESEVVEGLVVGDQDPQRFGHAVLLRVNYAGL